MSTEEEPELFECELAGVDKKDFDDLVLASDAALEGNLHDKG